MIANVNTPYNNINNELSPGTVPQISPNCVPRVTKLTSAIKPSGVCLASGNIGDKIIKLKKAICINKYKIPFTYCFLVICPTPIMKCEIFV